MDFVQFQANFQIDSGSKIYSRVYLESEALGAIAVTRDIDGNTMCRSYLREQLAHNSRIRKGYAIYNRALEFEFGLEEKNARLLILDNYPTKFDRKVFSELVNKLPLAFTNHLYKLKSTSTALVNVETESIYKLKAEIKRLNKIFDSIDSPANSSSCSIQEEPHFTQKMLFCKDSGAFRNLTMGMLYKLVGVDTEYYKIVDDFGVEREFKKERFQEVEVEE